jgi:molecular chaperone DnaK (HSP70)
VKNVRHKDPVQLVSRGAAAFGAALTGLVQVGKMPRIDAVPLAISIAVDMDDMHVIFERNRLYPCIEKRVLTTYTNNQNAIVIKVGTRLIV